MQRLLLEFKSLEDARMVKRQFEKELPYEVLASLSQRETEHILQNKVIHLLIQQSPDFKEAQAERIQTLRKMGYNYPILYILDQMNPLAEKCFAEEPKLFYLEKPFEIKMIQGLAKKLLTTRTADRQAFRRYHTNQKAALEAFISGEQFETKMLNLSKGGAYFELMKRPNMNVGELLRMKIQLEQMEKEHQVHGRIVWTTPKGHSGGRYGIGVEFIKSEEIYRHLLQSV